MLNFTEIVPGELVRRRGIRERYIVKYSDAGHVEGYILETVQDTDTVTIMTNRKSWP